MRKVYEAANLNTQFNLKDVKAAAIQDEADRLEPGEKSLESAMRVQVALTAEFGLISKSYTPDNALRTSSPPPTSSSSLRCDYCGRLGHDAKTCWQKHPELMPEREQQHIKSQAKALVAYTSTEEAEQTHCYFVAAATHHSTTPGKPNGHSHDGETHQEQRGYTSVDKLDQWVADTAASVHITNNLRILHNFTAIPPFKLIGFGGNSFASGYGSVQIRDSRGAPLLLRKVFYVKNAPCNVFSLPLATSYRLSFYGKEDHLVLKHPSSSTFDTARKQQNSYILKWAAKTTSVSLKPHSPYFVSTSSL